MENKNEEDNERWDKQEGIGEEKKEKKKLQEFKCRFSKQKRQIRLTNRVKRKDKL